MESFKRDAVLMLEAIGKLEGEVMFKEAVKMKEEEERNRIIDTLIKLRDLPLLDRELRSEIKEAVCEAAIIGIEILCDNSIYLLLLKNFYKAKCKAMELLDMYNRMIAPEWDLRLLDAETESEELRHQAGELREAVMQMVKEGRYDAGVADHAREFIPNYLAYLKYYAKGCENNK